VKVKAGISYVYYPNGLDRVDARTSLVPGDIVKVVNLPGCPPANTMGHAHVYLLGDTTKRAGLVSTNSLYPLSDAKIVVDAIKADIAARKVR
jgi:hypothetical protein